ncbi:DNA-processing protein DprA [Ekhidna sp.]|jgi:DNA processing protein|uniref:DNA-processing protein DprA n=1 Tax=Ekhidna sp. TaxID=2608089 RepID=UPI0032EBD00A
MSEELVFQIALELIPGVGNKGTKQLMSYCGSATEVFRASKSKLLKIPGVGEKMADLIKQSSPFKEAEAIFISAEKIGAEVLHYTHPDFPRRLKQVPDAPNIIYKKGAGDLNPKKSIAVVGTRKATEYGKSITDKIVADLASLNVTVISGLAYGIDIQAHKSSLNENTPTLAILAGGLDRIYPSVHKKYAEQMQETGAIISESVPGTKPDPHLFPARNRIIAGMADATIVVEAAAKGGALITANIADSYNRLVFAVPGDVGHTFSEGTNKLIATQRALIYTGVEDLIYHLNWDITQEDSKPIVMPELTQEEQSIYELLNENRSPLEIDLIAMKTQIPINQVASHLLSLEFKNLVKSMPGKKFGVV